MRSELEPLRRQRLARLAARATLSSPSPAPRSLATRATAIAAAGLTTHRVTAAPRPRRHRLSAATVTEEDRLLALVSHDRRRRRRHGRAAH